MSLREDYNSFFFSESLTYNNKKMPYIHSQNRKATRLIVVVSFLIGILFVSLQMREKHESTLSETIADNIRQHSLDWNFDQVIYEKEKQRHELLGSLYIFNSEISYVFENKVCGLELSFTRYEGFQGSPFYSITITITKPNTVGLNNDDSNFLGQLIYKNNIRPIIEKIQKKTDSTSYYSEVFQQKYNQIIQGKIKAKICKWCGSEDIL